MQTFPLFRAHAPRKRPARIIGRGLALNLDYPASAAAA